jgi:membrane-associated protease RseP (regulator of RpoE activity)
LTFLKNRPFPNHLSSIPSAPQVTAISADRINVNISADVFDHYTKNLSEILDSAFATPHFRKEKDGKRSIEGFEISRIKEGGIADRMSLQNGDIILAVNGEAIDSLEKVMKLVSQVQNMPQAVMTILRGTQKIEITFTRKYSGSNLGLQRDVFGGRLEYERPNMQSEIFGNIHIMTAEAKIFKAVMILAMEENNAYPIF